MPSTPAAVYPRRIVLLLAAAIFINYFDRGNLATASSVMQSELALSNTQLGLLFSAFFWSYAPMQPIAGWMAQRYDLRLVLGGGLALWALATTLTGLATSFTTILALRILLGLGESVAYPCNATILAQRVPVGARGRANGLVAVGQSLGPTAGTLIGGLFIASYGWRWAFIVFGLASLLWLIPWRAATAHGEVSSTLGTDAPIGYPMLLRERSLWGTSLGHFSGNYAYYFMLSWLPMWLVRVHGLSLPHMATVGALVYGVQAVVAPTVGWFCDRLVRSGAHPDRVFKTTIIAGHCGVAATMAACIVAGPSLAIALLLVAGLFFGMQSAPLGAISQTLAGPRAAGQWMGVQNLVANMAGVTAPLVTGVVVDRTGHFGTAFEIAAGVTLLGAFAFGLVVRRVQPIQWVESR